MKKDSGTHKVRRGVLGTVMNLILWIFSLSCIFPIVWMIYSSLNRREPSMRISSDFPRVRPSSTIPEF